MHVGLFTGDIPWDHLGGLQTRLSTLAGFLAAKGVDVEILATEQGAKQSNRVLEQLGNRIHLTCLHPRPLTAREPARSLVKCLTDLRAASMKLDLLDMYEPAFRIPSRWETPVIYTTNSGVEYVIRNLRSAGPRQVGLHALRNLLEIPVLYRASSIVTVSNLQKRVLTSVYGLPAGRISVIPEGYDADIVARNLRERESIGEARSIVFCGRLTHLKGVDLLTECFAELSASYQNWNLVLIGDGPLTYQLKRGYPKEFASGRISVTGALPHELALSLMSRSDIFVLPSLIEALPMALVEAMALSKAVIATDVGAIASDAVENNRTGILINPRNKPQLIQAMRKLLDDDQLRARLGRAARDRVNGQTLQRFLARTLQLYENIAYRSGHKLIV